MRDKLGMEESELPRKLLDCTEDELRDNYVKLLGVKLLNWCDRLLTSEREFWFKVHFCPYSGKSAGISRQFVDDRIVQVGHEGAACPDAGLDNLYHTDAPVNLFKMLDPQVDVALQPGGTPTFRLDLINQVAATLRKFAAGVKGLLLCFLCCNCSKIFNHLPSYTRTQTLSRSSLYRRLG